MAHAYVSNDRADPRDKFDLRPQILRTLTEAAQLVATAAWPGKSVTRNRIYLLYGLQRTGFERGYVEWELQPPAAGPGIANYREDIELSPFPENLPKFVDNKISHESTLGFVAMDYQAWEEIWRRGDLDRESMRFFIGLPKKLINFH